MSVHATPPPREKGQTNPGVYMPAEGGRRRDGGPAVQIGHLIAVLFRIITYRIRFNCMDGVRLKIVNRAIIKAPSVCLENLSRPLGIQRAAQILDVRKVCNSVCYYYTLSLRILNLNCPLGLPGCHRGGSNAECLGLKCNNLPAWKWRKGGTTRDQ